MSQMYNIKTKEVKFDYQVKDEKDWLPLEYDIKKYNKTTHRHRGYEFIIKKDKVIAKAIIIEKKKEEE